MTRDSRSLRFIQLAAIVLAVLAATITDPAAYGLSPVAVKWLALLSTIAGTVSGWLATSPLPGENDAQKVRSGSSSIVPMIALLAVLPAAMMLSGCGNAKFPVTLPTAGAVTVDQVHDQAAKAVRILDVALDDIREINGLEKQAEPQMSASQRTAVRAALTSAVDAITRAATEIQAGVQSIARLKAAVDPVLTQMNALQALVGGLPEAARSPGGWAKVLNVLGEVLGAALYYGPQIMGGVA